VLGQRPDGNLIDCNGLEAGNCAGTETVGHHKPALRFDGPDEFRVVKMTATTIRRLGICLTLPVYDLLRRFSMLGRIMVLGEARLAMTIL